MKYTNKEITCIKDFFSLDITWIKIKNSRFSLTCKIAYEDIILRRNDFPDEPMFTLYWREEVISFDDAPDYWRFIYDFDDNYEEKKRILET